MGKAAGAEENKWNTDRCISFMDMKMIKCSLD